MFSRPALLFLGLIVAEFLAIKVVASWLGWPMTIVVILLVSVVGFYYLGYRLPQTLRRSVKDVSQRKLDKSVVADQAGLVIAAVLLILPGLVSGLVGIALLITPIRRLLMPILGLSLMKRLSTSSVRFGAQKSNPFRADVVDVDIVDNDRGGQSEASSSHPPHLSNPEAP